ncbi:MAG: radical SAM protein [Candidatus Omnitrophota bacterium]|nr:radical SAM protein [Candidatus Omnitrophota bacterium]
MVADVFIGKYDAGDENKLDLLLINPSLNWELDQKNKMNVRIEKDIPNQETPHIGIAYLLAIAKKEGLKVKYIDMVIDCFSIEQLIDFVSKTKPAVVGFTAFTIQVRTAAFIAEKIKHTLPEVKICVGGPHVTAIPKETLDEFPWFDFVISGEGEEVLPKIFDSLGNDQALSRINGVITRMTEKVIVGASNNPILNLDSLPFPAWQEFNLSKYPGTYPHRTNLELPMVTGRGCPYRCVFCCRALGSTVRHRSVLSVIAEIERNISEFNCKSVAFLDETFLINMAWVDEFLNVFVDRGLHKKITWSCSTRVSDMSLELLKRMRNAGCYFIFFGLESADDQTLKLIKKNITTKQIEDVVRWTKLAGIIPVGAFIIGLPGDTEKHVMKAIAMAEKLDLYSVTFPIAVPFPGTELRQMALRGEYGMKIVSDNWSHYGKQDPGVMESKELSWSKRKELQQMAYLRNPKKKIADYLQRLSQNITNI